MSAMAAVALLRQLERVGAVAGSDGNDGAGVISIGGAARRADSGRRRTGARRGALAREQPRDDDRHDDRHHAEQGAEPTEPNAADRRVAGRLGPGQDQGASRPRVRIAMIRPSITK